MLDELLLHKQQLMFLGIAMQRNTWSLATKISGFFRQIAS
jgi:hypothetical protein